MTVEGTYCMLCHQVGSHAEDCPLKTHHLTWDRDKMHRIGRALRRNNGYCPCVVESDGKPEWQCPCEQLRDGGDCHCGLYERGNGR